MPVSEHLLPYLNRIDESKWYTNFGKLVQELECKLESMLEAPCVTTANGTLALDLAIRALELPLGSKILVPAVTFHATGLAVLAAGHIPILCDVHPSAWILTPEIAQDVLRENYPSDISAVIPVAAFGRPVPIESWECFAETNNIPVVIDAAGAFPAQQVSAKSYVLTVFSTHATKFMSSGEGGFVASHNKTIIDTIRSLSNFGLVVGKAGMNAKMSEYHAAVALASLARLEETKEAMRELHAYYTDSLPANVHCQLRPLSGHYTHMPVLLPDSREGFAHYIKAKLADLDIDTKQWYRPFLDEHPVFHTCQKTPLPVTRKLRQRMLGLPFHSSLTKQDIDHVCSQLNQVLASDVRDKVGMYEPSL